MTGIVLVDHVHQVDLCVDDRCVDSVPKSVVVEQDSLCWVMFSAHAKALQGWLREEVK